MSSELLKQTIASVLNELEQRSVRYFAIVGLDGFVDKIQKPVKYQDLEGCNYYESLDGFGQRIKEASNQSAQIELDTSTVKLGGNAPIFANALAELNIRNLCLGTFGTPQIHPVFRQMHPDCKLISVGNAAETNALEFDDGKLILSELSTFSKLDWQSVRTKTDLHELARAAQRTQLIALVDWCNLPHASDIWKGFLKDVVKPAGLEQMKFFFDLADPSRKASDEVKEALEIINQFSDFGEVTLGLNENEALKLSMFLGLEVEELDEHLKLQRVGRLLFDFMNIHQLIIHPIDGCILINQTEELYLDGRVVLKPKVTTGGGDNFNAGFCFGQLNGYTGLQSMVLAMATSGAYVQNGESPNFMALREYLAQWLEE